MSNIVTFPPDETPKPMPGSRLALATIRTRAALAVARFELDLDAVALADVVGEIVALCNSELLVNGGGR